LANFAVFVMLALHGAGCLLVGQPHIANNTTAPSWSISSMSYIFGFPKASCDVDVEQTLEVNYSSGNFTSGILFIPEEYYDSLEFYRIVSNNITIDFTTINEGDLYWIHYTYPQITAPATKTFTFTYKAISATKTFSRSGSSSNSFSWETVGPKFPDIGALNVELNLYFHTATEDSIESSPAYSTLEQLDEYTTVIFPTERNIPPGSSKMHQISFPKRITCSPASNYNIIALAVVIGCVTFALGTTLAALVIRKARKLKKEERFEQLNELT